MFPILQDSRPWNWRLWGSGETSLGNRESTLLDLTHGQLVLGLMHKVNFYIQQLEMFWMIYMMWIRMTIKPEAG